MGLGRDASIQELTALFEDVEESFPKSLGPDKWYLMLIAALSYASDPNHIGDLYTHLISRPEFSTRESRQALVRRIREALFKLVSILGICKPLTAVFKVDSVENPEDKDYSFSRKGWQADEKNLERGNGFLKKIYQHNSQFLTDKLVAHKDFDWITWNIIYGLYLSDHSILSDVETELVVMCGILIQNLTTVAGFHLRGARRIGMSKEEVEQIHICCEKVARFSGVRMDKIPRVADIEDQVPWESDTQVQATQVQATSS
ncbi:hypothetical protein TWF225_005835 [Orbilia oligospora]|nr:hypothetical protein TWF225_005835 [Orbilia oligospora]KAF3184931.1 hypothetical protein TWF225_005835 [Orbilia oligospora]KAF3271233.1 hypothetical protein TWF217_005639 [Orbilia oligospora]KAF3271234.1 hypothetical protein TWF217_005639 [Orbilia oligospora]KAF3271784.1 hypothetical protein TWF128_000324 [Orbilia oligospora]